MQNKPSFFFTNMSFPNREGGGVPHLGKIPTFSRFFFLATSLTKEKNLKKVLLQSCILFVHSLAYHYKQQEKQKGKKVGNNILHQYILIIYILDSSSRSPEAVNSFCVSFKMLTNKFCQLRQELQCLSWSITYPQPLFQIFQILQILK